MQDFAMDYDLDSEEMFGQIDEDEELIKEDYDPTGAIQMWNER